MLVHWVMKIFHMLCLWYSIQNQVCKYYNRSHEKDSKYWEVVRLTVPANKFLLLISHSVMSNSLWPHGLQHARLLCSSPTPGVCSNSCASSWWCHPTILSSVVPASPPAFNLSQHLFSLEKSRLFESGSQSIGASASVLPMNIQDWSLLGWTGWISMQSKGLSRGFSSTTVQKHQFFGWNFYLFVFLDALSSSDDRNYLLEACFSLLFHWVRTWWFCLTPDQLASHLLGGAGAFYHLQQPLRRGSVTGHHLLDSTCWLALIIAAG